MVKGLVVSLSGPDGSGKSTLIEQLEGRLEAPGRKPIVLWTRLGYTPGFEAVKTAIRRVLGRGIPQQGDGIGRERVMRRRSVEATWLVAACADLLFTYAARVRAMARRGRVVICDRYVWDALIDRRMFFPNEGWVDAVIRRGFGLVGRRPDLALLLSLPYETARDRSESKNEPFPDRPEVRLIRHRLYGELAADGALHVLDATRTPGELADEVVDLLKGPMKISLLLEREPFPAIFEQTMSRHLSAETGRPHRITWHSGRPAISDLLRRTEGLWLCNPAINAIFSVRAAAKVFETPWREYLRGPNPIATASHAVFLLGSTAPVARVLVASQYVRIEPDLDGAEEMLILGGNSRLKLVDHRRGRVTTILKEGFDETLMHRELLFRTSGQVAMAPLVLEVSDDRQAFVEPLLHGTVADRLLFRGRAKEALLQTLDACDRLAEGTRKTCPLAEWCRAAVGVAGAASERVRDDGSVVARRAVDWMGRMCLWLTGEGSEGGGEVETAMSHGDLQPGNVLVERERVWLIDWERVDERVPWYDAMTLALDARRGYAGLVDRALELSAGRRSDEIGRKAREMLVRRGGEHGHVGRIVMYLIEEIRFCLEESAMGPLVGPADSLAALVRELDRAGHRLVAEAPSRDTAAVIQ